MALAGNKADMLEARQVPVEVCNSASWISLLTLHTCILLGDLSSAQFHDAYFISSQLLSAISIISLLHFKYCILSSYIQYLDDKYVTLC